MLLPEHSSRRAGLRNGPANSHHRRDRRLRTPAFQGWRHRAGSRPLFALASPTTRDRRTNSYSLMTRGAIAVQRRHEARPRPPVGKTALTQSATPRSKSGHVFALPTFRQGKSFRNALPRAQEGWKVDEQPNSTARVPSCLRRLGPAARSARLRMPRAMDDMNPADLATLQPHFDPTRVKLGLGEKVLDNASCQFPCGLVLFEDN